MGTRMTWRVGLLIPSSNSVMEVDFYRSLPYDTTLHTARMYVPDGTGAGEERMLDEFTMPAAESIRTAVTHIVVFGSMTGGALRGKEYDRELCERIGTVTCAVPVSVVASVNQALRDTRAARVAVVTPYTDTVNQRIKASIEAEGIEVSAIHGMGIFSFDTASVTPEGIYSFVQSRIGPRVKGDALFLAGTNFHAMGAVSLLKVAYDVPIVTSNMAALQAVKRTLDRLRERAMPEVDLPLARANGHK
jgi:maleate isomerase